jgi:hypothetical protein
VLGTYFTIFLQKVKKGIFVSYPCLQNIVFFAGVEASTEEDPILIFGAKALRSNDNLELRQDKVYLP